MEGTNVRIFTPTHQEASQYCFDNGLKLYKFCDDAIKEKLEKVKKSKKQTPKNEREKQSN